MKSFSRPLLQFPVVWIILACAAVIGSWIMTQRLLPVRTPHLYAPGVIQNNPQPRITEDRAIAVALNDFEISPDQITLQHPRHQATFTEVGVTFKPRGGGPEWSWQLSQVRVGADALAGVELAGVFPTADSGGIVQYLRGPLIEQYVARADHLEQQFVLPERLPLVSGDLVIIGDVTSAGRFETTDGGWRWQDSMGEVHLGDVYVFDAAGVVIPATMRVTPTQTEIMIAGTHLSQATYPVTIDPEIGANDFRLSDMGGDALYDAANPDLAYNPTRDEYLVVWEGDDNSGSLVDEEGEIFGQRVDGASGAEIGTPIRLSDMGPDGDPAYDAAFPAVAYNLTINEYLVVWMGDDNTGSQVDEEFEIYGQRVAGDTGAEIGGDIRLSEMGPDGDQFFDAFSPAVAYNATQEAYLVVWQGEDNTSPLVNEEFEIFGQLVEGNTGAEIGGDVRLSDMGPDGDPTYDAFSPAVAYNPTHDEYLVVWHGDDNTSTLVVNEPEIFGQRVAGPSGAEIGSDLRLSEMGPDGDPSYGAFNPAVVFSPIQNEYLVVWVGDDNTGSLVDNEYEIYGQRVAGATGADIGGDVRLSAMGIDGDPDIDASWPAVAYNLAQDEYLVVWEGDDNTSPLVDDEKEIYGQRVAAATGAEIGGDIRLSDMGPDGDPNYDAFIPAVAYNPTQDEFLVVWHGDDNTSPLVEGEAEIFGQRVAGVTGAEIGANDFQLSVMGGDTIYEAAYPAVAYNPTQEEYLVIWEGDDNTGTLVDGETEIFGQLVAADTGAEIGGDVRLSDMGPDGNSVYGAFNPDVAFNPTQDEYLVVWYGDDNTGLLVNGEYEIYGQRVDANTGAEIGNDFRLSDMGPDGVPIYDAFDPAVAYNPIQGEYLVVWDGDDNTSPLVDGETEIFGQLVAGASGAEIGGDMRLSDMGPDGDTDYDASSPAVVYNSTQVEYLVVWHSDDNTSPMVDNEFEIFGQRVAADTGAEIGGDMRLSDMGPDGDQAYTAINAAVAYNPTQNAYLVVWESDDNTSPLADNEFEIYGQRVAGASGAEIGGDIRLSDMGPDGDPDYDAFSPAVAYNPIQGEYLVVWHGDDNTGSLVDEEFEIFTQRVAGASGAEIGGDVRLSDMGPDGDLAYGALTPVVAYSPIQDAYLVVWEGNDNERPLVVTEVEIFGQRYSPDFNLYLPLIRRE